jgi:16S rRNA (uracil1498-N3)-methyltransferase
VLTLFFVPAIGNTSHLVVDGDEAHHAIKVLRIVVGDELMLADGQGAWVRGQVSTLDKKSFAVEVLERGYAEASTQELIVIQALMKSDRAKEAIELLTVAGADRIIPWQSERSIAKWQHDLGSKWLTTAMTAAKQSRRLRLPEIEPPITTKQIATRFGVHANLLVLHEGAATRLSELGSSFHSGAIVLVIGPEGGLSDHELELLSEAGGQIVLLGNQVLRSAHAGFAGLAAISTMIARW